MCFFISLAYLDGLVFLVHLVRLVVYLVFPDGVDGLDGVVFLVFRVGLAYRDGSVCLGRLGDEVFLGRLECLADWVCLVYPVCLVCLCVCVCATEDDLK